MGIRGTGAFNKGYKYKRLKDHRFKLSRRSRRLWTHRDKVSERRRRAVSDGLRGARCLEAGGKEALKEHPEGTPKARRPRAGALAEHRGLSSGGPESAVAGFTGSFIKRYEV